MCHYYALYLCFVYIYIYIDANIYIQMHMNIYVHIYIYIYVEGFRWADVYIKRDENFCYIIILIINYFVNYDII